MRTTISVDEEKFEQLMKLSGTSNRTEAVNLAIDAFIRQERVQRFKKLRGKLDLPSNEVLEEAEAKRAEDLYQR